MNDNPTNAKKPVSRKLWRSDIDFFKVSPFTNGDYAKVRKCLAAIRPEYINNTLTARVEIAAFFVGAVISHLEQITPNLEADEVHLLIESILGRAYELKAQRWI